MYMYGTRVVSLRLTSVLLYSALGISSETQPITLRLCSLSILRIGILVYYNIAMYNYNWTKTTQLTVHLISSSFHLANSCGSYGPSSNARIENIRIDYMGIIIVVRVSIILTVSDVGKERFLLFPLALLPLDSQDELEGVDCVVLQAWASFSSSVFAATLSSRVDSRSVMLDRVLCSLLISDEMEDCIEDSIECTSNSGLCGASGRRYSPGCQDRSGESVTDEHCP